LQQYSTVVFASGAQLLQKQVLLAANKNLGSVFTHRYFSDTLGAIVWFRVTGVEFQQELHKNW